ncbi:MAG: hypothetical protein JSR17_06280 [Proteobacteria bacterium]|nr:hypothetical protein [Pseudomonadota bacterium]
MNKQTNSKSLLCKGLGVFGLLLYVFSLTINADSDLQKANPASSVTNAFSDAISSQSMLPVIRNRFVVDKGAKEIEILVATDDFQALQLLSPDNKQIIPAQGAPNVTWQRIEKLYAVKVQSPLAGQWQIQGNLLSYPQVVVVSDLDMVTPLYPNNLIRGETLALSVYLQEAGKKIIQGDILTSTQITASLQNIATSEIYKIYLIPDEKAKSQSNKGVFRYDYRLDGLPGIYRLDILAQGLLFQRERHQQFYLYDYPGKVNTQINAQDDEMIVKVNVSSPLFDISTCQLSAILQNSDGSTQTMMLDKKADDSWQLNLPASPDITKMSVAISGYLKDTRLVQVVFPEVKVDTLYNQAYLDLEQNQLLKSNQNWQRMQADTIEYMLPFSTNKQIESYFAGYPITDNEALKPLTNYPTYMQSLLRDWESKLFANQEEEWMNRLGGDPQVKKPVLTKAQIQANLLAEQKAKAQALARKQAAMQFAHKKKLLIMIFSLFCFVFIAMLAGVLLYIFAPKLKARFAAKAAEEAKPAQEKPTEEVKPAQEDKPAEEVKPAEEAKPAQEKPTEEVKPAQEAKPAEEAKPTEEASAQESIDKAESEKPEQEAQAEQSEQTAQTAEQVIPNKPEQSQSPSP